ncbi:MAG: ABC transporter substrate-binding protein [Gammaproteobacteria bacterium]|nr:ABC transporter substrate-binding protein [Gammaproteobacteria bacterium]
MNKRNFIVWTVSAFGLPVSWAQPNLDTIILAGWSRPITESVNLFVDEYKHFFADQNIKLIYLPGNGGDVAMQNLLLKHADIAFTDPGSFFITLSRGEKIRAIYDIYPKNVFNIVWLQKNKWKGVKDLKGKKIGVFSHSSATKTNLLLMLELAGLKSTDVEIVVTGPLNFAPLITSQVDALASTDTAVWLAQKKRGVELTILQVQDFINYSSDLFVVREETYLQKPALLKRFIAAYRNSFLWMKHQPEEAALLAKKVVLDGEIFDESLGIIHLRIKSSQSEFTGKYGLGTVNVDSLQNAANLYHRLGLIDKPILVAPYTAVDF